MRFNGRATTDAQALAALVVADGASGGFVKDADRATDAEARAQASSTKVLTPSNLAARAAFSVSLSASKADIATDTYTKLPFDTEALDVGAYFDAATNYAWTPPAGPVRLSAGVYLSAGLTDATLASIRITKNGTGFRQAITYEQMTGQTYASISIADVANGSDSYAVEVFGTTASAITASGGTATNSYFMGEQI